jgi:hypothetical protein
MLSLLLFAQLAVVPDSAYSSAALRAVVAHAAAENRAPPPAFRGYKAHMETELSLILRDTLGRENAAQVEQFASTASWVRDSDYEVHVVGYRSQGVGVPYSMLSFIKGWTVPSLYGERLRLGVQVPTPDSSARARDEVIAVHPFANDRDRYYRFTGGDTVGVLHTGKRNITIVRVHASPHLPDSARVAAFDGDIQIDAERGQIVRMRGQFVVRGGNERRSLMSRIPGTVAVAYCDFTNAEIDGRYWLPASQRTEFQAAVALLGRSRAVMRVLSEFSGFEVVDGDSSARSEQRRIAHITTWAPPDSVAHFDDWRATIGTITASVAAADFDDIGPDIWRTTGPPRFDLFPTRTGHVIGFDRVGGLYTGLEGTVHMRDALPGLSAGAHLGWAWSEATARGGANVSYQRGPWSYTILGERRLISTNDFVRPFEAEDGGIAALVGSVDDFDYVDRKRALVSIARGGGSQGLVTLQMGAGRDQSEVARLSHGLFGGTDFRPNRGATTGSYALATLIGDWHPNISGDFVQPGVGTHVLLEDASGQLAWRRFELSLNARRYLGPVTLALHGDAGAVTGAEIPPQLLYELGGSGSLFGYEYKQFAGNRAALFRGYASYTLPVWRTPRRAWRNFYVPGFAPGFAIGASGGWTELSSPAALRSVTQFGVSPIPTATGGVRATVGGGVTLFGGNLHLGVARAVDRSAPWKLALGLGQEF